jgi:hypothetical protein
MPRECPACGATATLEARFCRRCGASLKGNGGHDTDSPISPMAQTVPLADEGRTTDGLWTEESHELASGTSRIRRTEMEDLLRRVSREHDGDGRSHHSSLAQADGSGLETPPFNSTLQTPSAAAAPAPSDNTSSTPITTGETTARSPRRTHPWHWAIFSLFCVTLVAGLLGLIAYRRSRVTGVAGDTPVAPVSEEKQTDASTAEAVPQPEQATAPAPSSPATAAGPETSPARSTEAASHSSSEGSAASRTTTPPLETRQTTPPTTPALSAGDHYQRGVQLWEGDRRAALEEFRAAAKGGVADAYFYLGTEYYPAGRDPRTLSEGELKAALNYFLRAGGGPHSAQASRAAQALGKEYERRKKQSRP